MEIAFLINTTEPIASSIVDQIRYSYKTKGKKLIRNIFYMFSGIFDTLSPPSEETASCHIKTGI